MNCNLTMAYWNGSVLVTVMKFYALVDFRSEIQIIFPQPALLSLFHRKCPQVIIIHISYFNEMDGFYICNDLHRKMIINHHDEIQIFSLNKEFFTKMMSTVQTPLHIASNQLIISENCIGQIMSIFTDYKSC